MHHYGLRGKVNRRGTEVKYAERQFLGINDSVEILVGDTLMRFLGG